MGDTITISREEYDRLCEAAEDLQDIIAFDRAVAAIESGEEEVFPAEVVRRLVDGENPVRVYRELRGLTQVGLGERSGVNRVQIADIEAGRKSGSIDTIRKLADALDVTIDDLV